MLGTGNTAATSNLDSGPGYSPTVTAEAFFGNVIALGKAAGAALPCRYMKPWNMLVESESRRRVTIEPSHPGMNLTSPRRNVLIGANADPLFLFPSVSMPR